MFERIIPLLENAEKVGIFAHENPDGDALGSSYSLKLVFQSLGKQAEVYLSAKPDQQAFEIVKGKSNTGLKAEDCDLLVAVDCAAPERLGEYKELFLNHKNTVAIDHHITHVHYAKEAVVEGCSSCCELMYRLYGEMGCTISPEIAHNVYLGMVCDTGRFQFPDVTPNTLRVAAELMEQGADFSDISKKIFDTKTRGYYALMQTALNRLLYFEDGRVCALYLGMDDFEAAGIDEAGAAGIVTMPSSIDGVEVGIYIREREKGSYKVSLRSPKTVDVSAVAVALGGGGHVRASGYGVAGKSLPEMLDEVLAEIKKQLKEDRG
ncbi:MAG: bifunctional oligoribonuclease/PAP phosphatase NrnA [Clostridia bacterium]|nr:bifunctional oligoribonuclease/PAP phosphatase NrnA [Clostridia bacterium]